MLNTLKSWENYGIDFKQGIDIKRNGILIKICLVWRHIEMGSKKAKRLAKRMAQQAGLESAFEDESIDMGNENVSSMGVTSFDEIALDRGIKALVDKRIKKVCKKYNEDEPLDIQGIRNEIGAYAATHTVKHCSLVGAEFETLDDFLSYVESLKGCSVFVEQHEEYIVADTTGLSDSISEYVDKAIRKKGLTFDVVTFSTGDAYIKIKSREKKYGLNKLGKRLIDDIYTMGLYES